MLLGNIASIATLLLFVFYFIGRFITIFRERNLFPDEIKMVQVGFDPDEFDIVESFELEHDPFNAIILTSKQGIYDLSVYKIEYDNGKCIGREKLKDYQYKFLNIGQSIVFYTTVLELLETYQVEYYTRDYKKVTIALWANLKNVILSESAKPKHTAKSVMFHLLN